MSQPAARLQVANRQSPSHLVASDLSSSIYLGDPTPVRKRGELCFPPTLYFCDCSPTSSHMRCGTQRAFEAARDREPSRISRRPLTVAGSSFRVFLRIQRLFPDSICRCGSGFFFFWMKPREGLVKRSIDRCLFFL